LGQAGGRREYGDPKRLIVLRKKSLGIKISALQYLRRW